jgi:hypothetical protein
MEIKEILSELILVAQSLLNEKGQPENFDLEDFIYQMEGYHQELDEAGEFYYEGTDDEWSDEYDDDSYFSDYEN